MPDKISRDSKYGALTNTELRNLDSLLSRFWAYHAPYHVVGPSIGSAVTLVRELGGKLISERDKATRKYAADSPHGLTPAMDALLISVARRESINSYSVSTIHALSVRGLIEISPDPGQRRWQLTETGLTEAKRSGL